MIQTCLILVYPGIKRPNRGRVFWYDNSAELAISQTELELWIDFFLKYYRDGIADVDHMDIDIYQHFNKGKGIFLTFHIPNSRPPVSAEEASRLLGPP